MDWNFKALTIDAYDEIVPILNGAKYGRCEYTFGTLLMYSDVSEYVYCIVDDVLYVKGNTPSGEFFYAPVTSDREKFKVGMQNIYDYAKERNVSVKVISIPSELEKEVEIQCEISQVYADYVYDAEAFVSLSGKKYHGKRNHISRFEREIGEYKFEKITRENISIVEEFFQKFKERESKESDMFSVELKATETLLKNYLYTGFYGYALTTHGQVIGFTVGEIIGDTLMVHVEKCDKSVKGVYEKIANLFLKQVMAENDIKYVNREDDAGDEGLKKAKLSYNPLYMAEKIQVKIG